MKMFKRFAAALLAGVMVLAMLTACGGIGNDAATAKFEAKQKHFIWMSIMLCWRPNIRTIQP